MNTLSQNIVRPAIAMTISQFVIPRKPSLSDDLHLPHQNIHTRTQDVTQPRADHAADNFLTLLQFARHDREILLTGAGAVDSPLVGGGGDEGEEEVEGFDGGLEVGSKGVNSRVVGCVAVFLGFRRRGVIVFIDVVAFAVAVSFSRDVTAFDFQIIVAASNPHIRNSKLPLLRGDIPELNHSLLGDRWQFRRQSVHESLNSSLNFMQRQGFEIRTHFEGAVGRDCVFVVVICGVIFLAVAAVVAAGFAAGKFVMRLQGFFRRIFLAVEGGGIAAPAFLFGGASCHCCRGGIGRVGGTASGSGSGSGSRSGDGVIGRRSILGAGRFRC
mmetsp:Transcript_5949/g.12383  ORF Transcript_5949/g.12383 Transcript_5949/m.12383 type:complete len:327 (+) Transcript_5949:700-1680(+)